MSAAAFNRIGSGQRIRLQGLMVLMMASGHSAALPFSVSRTL